MALDDAHRRPGAPPIHSICLISKDYPPNTVSGISRAVQGQARRLAARGIEVHVITRAERGSAATRTDGAVTVHEVPEPTIGVPRELGYFEIPLWSLAAAIRYAELDARHRFDIVEAPDFRGEALHLDHRPETALVVWLHTTLKACWDVEPGYVMDSRDRVWHALEMAAMERADLLLGPSQLLIDTTKRLLGDRMRPVELMPLLFEAEEFPARTRVRAEGPIEILYFGRLEGRKNPEMGLHVAAAARERGLDVRLTVMGADFCGYRKRVLRPLEQRLGLGDINYLPHADVTMIREVLARADVAVLASRFDNSPLSVLEALSTGVPVITSDQVGTASWISREDGLLALDLSHPADFVRQAVDAIADPGWLATGEHAAHRIREIFAPEVVTDRLLDAYRRLIECRTPRSRAATPADAAVVGSDLGATAAPRAGEPAAALPDGELHAAGGEHDPTVSVVISCFNYGRYLRDSVSSVLAQTFTDFELIIVDDGSTDDSLQVAERLAATDPRISVITQPNSGEPAIPRNRAIERARGRYVLSLDADDKLSPDLLGACAAALDSDPRAGIAYCRHQEFGAGSEMHEMAPWSRELLARWNIHHSSSMFRRKSWEQAGGYGLGIRGYEDWDLWLGIAELDWLGRAVHGPIAYYRKHAGSVYTQSVARDRELKAKLVLHRSDLYNEFTIAWARAVLHGERWAANLDPGPGFIPILTEPVPRSFMPVDQMPGLRSTVVLAFAQELIGHPELLRAYGEAISGEDDVTLAAVLPEGSDPAPLVAAVEAAGLDGEDAAELVALPLEPPGAAAVLSRVGHHELWRVDAASVDQLAELVGARAADATLV